jgi:hypothetical protein
LLLYTHKHEIMVELGWRKPLPIVSYDGMVLRQSQRLKLWPPRSADVFFGDSIVFQMRVNDIDDKAENLGIPGDTVEGATHRLPQYDFSTARCLVFSVGVNNWYQDGFKDFGAKYSAMLDQSPKGVPIVAMAITPLNPEKNGAIDPSKLLAAIRSANGEIRAACRRHVGCEFWDMKGSLADKTGRLLGPYDAGDGIHMSASGSAVWMRSAGDGVTRYCAPTKTKAPAVSRRGSSS